MKLLQVLYFVASGLLVVAATTIFLRFCLRQEPPSAALPAWFRWAFPLLAGVFFLGLPLAHGSIYWAGESNARIWEEARHLADPTTFIRAHVPHRLVDPGSVDMSQYGTDVLQAWCSEEQFARMRRVATFYCAACGLLAAGWMAAAWQNRRPRGRGPGMELPPAISGEAVR